MFDKNVIYNELQDCIRHIREGLEEDTLRLDMKYIEGFIDGVFLFRVNEEEE